MIVIGCAIAKRTFVAMFMSRKKFDIKAIANWAALMPINLWHVSEGFLPLRHFQGFAKVDI